jgi:hypothetical protein
VLFEVRQRQLWSSKEHDKPGLSQAAMFSGCADGQSASV